MWREVGGGGSRSVDQRAGIQRTAVGALGLNELIANRVSHQLSCRPDREFAHRSRPMRLDSFDADVQRSRNHLVAAAFSDELHDLSFARRQAGRVSRHSRIELIQKRLGHLVRKKRTMSRKRRHGVENLLVGFRSALQVAPSYGSLVMNDAVEQRK